MKKRRPNFVIVSTKNPKGYKKQLDIHLAVKLVRGQNVLHINYALWFLPLKYQMTVITRLNFIESKEFVIRVYVGLNSKQCMVFSIELLRLPHLFIITQYFLFSSFFFFCI